jgi:hypothetical protein
MIDEEKLLEAVSKRRERHGNTIVTLELFESILREAGSPAEFSWQAPATPPQLYVKPEFPKTLVRIGDNKETLEERVVNSHEEATELRRNGGTWYQWEG